MDQLILWVSCLRKLVFLMMNKKFLDRIKEALEETRYKRPLVEQLTNFVTINDCANATLSIGASPVMADGDEEVKDMTAISNALVINFGIINLQPVETMIKAAKSANENYIPVVFDPVGMGAIPFINETILHFLNEVKVDVIKGNASEIMSLAGVKVETKGVDSSESSLNSIESAVKVARKYRCVCAVTGEIDIVTDGKTIVKIHNGYDKMSYITGTGCMISSLVGSVLGSGCTPLIGACAGILAMSISGEKAKKQVNPDELGISTYRTKLMDNIYLFNGDDIDKYARIEIENIESEYSMYLITDEAACLGKDFYKSVEDSILGGAKIVQLREKNLSTREFYERAKKLKEICSKHDVKFVINDRVDIAMAVDADGVHLGQSDMHIEICKELIGYNKIVGISAKNIEEAMQAQHYGADYIGVGALFTTKSKDDADYVSKEDVQKICDVIDIPVLGIGGIKLENMDEISDLDIDGICVISDILNSEECKKRTEELVSKFRKNKNF